VEWRLAHGAHEELAVVCKDSSHFAACWEVRHVRVNGNVTELFALVSMYLEVYTWVMISESHARVEDAYHHTV
jgi:hypothetical protein